MQPVICFYEKSKFIYSTDYVLESCDIHQSVSDFLTAIEQKFSEQMKIVKINYDALEQTIIDDKRQTFVKTAKVQVFVLNSFELLEQTELEYKHPSKPKIWPAYYPTISETEFIEKIKSIKEDICRGRFYQMNFTAALKAQVSNNYSILEYFIHQSPQLGCDYRAYLPLDQDQAIACFSPEMFLLKKNDSLKTQPIKGTVRTGENINNLKKSSKENAELSMIVDLLRNDLNTLSCEVYKDRSQVNFHREILDLGYTAHTYSEIEIKTSKNLSEIIDKTFPGGSISGCPKKESLKKISEIEHYHRDFYTGSIGWWLGNNFCLNIAIRSLYQNKNQLFYFTGCGIVFDSDPQSEWLEFLSKCSFLNLQLSYDPVIDTLKFDQEILYKSEHIERTCLALQNQQIDIELSVIQDIYNKIEKDLKFKNFSEPQKVRLIFEKNLSYEIEISSLPETLSTVILQPIYHRQFLPHFKTADRSIWNRLLENKDFNADDILIINGSHKVIETSIYSIFYKMGDEMYTPPLSEGGLFSVFKNHALKKGFITFNNKTYKLSERSLLDSELTTVELYVGNSLRELRPARLLFKYLK